MAKYNGLIRCFIVWLRTAILRKI